MTDACAQMVSSWREDEDQDHVSSQCIQVVVTWCVFDCEPDPYY